MKDFLHSNKSSNFFKNKSNNPMHGGEKSRPIILDHGKLRAQTLIKKFPSSWAL